jgi:hypothetical protein
MRTSETLAALIFALSALGLPACANLKSADNPPNPIVGTWVVKDSGAPFPYHMYVFNADGTMQQANPDAGDIRSSDSDGKGIWVTDGDAIKGKWVEVTADRTTHEFSGRNEISYDIKVSGDTFIGTLTARFYDARGTLTGGLTNPSLLEGKRVVLP